MSNLGSVGATLITLGVASFLLSLIGLEFKGLGFLGEYKIYVEGASVAIGVILTIIAKVFKKNENENEEQN